MGRFAFAQLSDTHVRADDDGKAAAQLRKALKQARAYRVDAVLITGDLANDARVDEYALLAEALADPPAPVFLLPGNHDDGVLLRGAFPGHAYLPRERHLSYAIDDFPVRLVALDQTAPEQTHGVFGPELAEWLDRTLAQAAHKPTVVALHHPPFRTYDLLFDGIGLWGADLFAATIARHRQVVRVVCGHHHRFAMGQVAHAPALIAPSTSWAYGLALNPEQQIAPHTQEQPGWVLHVWSEEGGLASMFMGL